MNKVFTFEKLYRAYLNCRQSKRKTMSALEFELKLERNLFFLLKELEERRYSPGRSICFAVKDPTPREIFAASFRDRVVHHLLINEIIEAGERSFIYNSFSCREGKGTHKAIERLKKCMRQISKNNRENAYYMQLDISGFFMSIDKEILFLSFEKLISKQNKSEEWKEDILWLGKKTIFHNPTKNYLLKGDASLFRYIHPKKSLFKTKEGKGLPIGNYSSQFFSNLYLNKLDQFVKRELRCKYYLRYVDDFILLDKSKERLKLWEIKINNFLKKELKLELNKKKTKIQLLKTGIDFLGYIVKPDYILVRKKVVKRLKDKLYKQKPEELQKLLATINSYYGHFRHAYSFSLRKGIYRNHLGKELQRKVLAKDVNFFSLVQKK